MSRRTARTGRGRSTGKGTKKPTRKQREAARDYADRRRRVQPLVTFTIPKTGARPADKAKLTRYYNYLFGDNGVALGAKVAVRRKDPEKLLKLQRQFGQGNLPGVKAVFIRTYADPVTGELVRPKIKHRKKNPDVVVFPVERYDAETDTWEVAGEVQTQFLEFDKQAMLTDPAGEVRRVAQELANLAGVDVERAYFRVRNGENEIKENRLIDSTISKVIRYQNDYADWQHWLDGLIIEVGDGYRNSVRDYQRAKQAVRDRRKKIGKMNVDHVRLLNVINKTKNGAMTEIIAMKAEGSVDRAVVEKVKNMLEAMRRKKLVMGDDTRWMMTPHGRKVLADARVLLSLFFKSDE